MAATTRFLASSSGGVALLNYDDVTLLATGVTVANVGGTEAIMFFISILGTVHSATIAKGQTSFISLSPSVAITIGIDELGGPSFVIAGLDSYGIGSG
jgi:hypothetical protein